MQGTEAGRGGRALGVGQFRASSKRYVMYQKNPIQYLQPNISDGSVRLEGQKPCK